MKREADYWDYLISPSPYCSQILPKAFNTEAKVLELGYPRNDRLAQIKAPERQAIREKLGITDPELTLVLYAPTWRDTNRGTRGGWESVDYLNEYSELPPGFKLLFRGHSNTHASHEKRQSQNAIDVTFYPDVADLFIAADVLITDFSSVMFDFSVTGKPLIFLAPDLEHYESHRGFYFDFRQAAIGPICKDASEAIKALTELPSMSTLYAEKYRAWQEKFNSKDDGNSAIRVIKAVWN
jgi:CDP-glycerol glycerophosphotransferase